MDRKPKGYIGTNHETIGSDILSVVKVAAVPSLQFGKDLAARLLQVKADQWYPIALLLEPVEILAKELGDRGLVAIGIRVFQMSHEAAVKKNIHSAAELFYGFDAIYRSANRGQNIGGWKVLSFGKGEAVLEKTTPHHCKMEEGILRQALIAIDAPATVTQTQCFRQGADRCVLAVKSVAGQAHWGKAQ